MQLSHFKSPAELLEYIADETVAELLLDKWDAMGLRAEHYTDEQLDEIENKIADIEAAKPLLLAALG